MARAEFLFDFGIDACALHKRSQDADVKADLMASTEDAAKRGVEEALAG